jgi:mannose-6-phosphate isomerase-like protein (cupin superfamily)
MADVTVKTIDDFDTAFGGAMKLVRHGLGVQSFGLQIEDFPPNADQYPEHDHSEDSQEEVFIVAEGRATLQVGGEEFELGPWTCVRVGPGEKRKIVTGPEGARVIAIGATPGKAYEAPEFTVPQEGQQA